MIVAGFGFRAGATAASLTDAYARAAQGRRVAAAASVADKAQQDCFVQAAATLCLPVIAVPQAEIERAATLTKSRAALEARGTGSLAEAAALVAAGPEASLLGARVVSADRMATCALAERIEP